MQLLALQSFPMGTWDHPLPFLASSPERQLNLQAHNQGHMGGWEQGHHLMICENWLAVAAVLQQIHRAPPKLQTPGGSLIAMRCSFS